MTDDLQQESALPDVEWNIGLSDSNDGRHGLTIQYRLVTESEWKVIAFLPCTVDNLRDLSLELDVLIAKMEKEPS